MSRAALVVDLARAYPRTRWYRSDALAAIAAACTLVAALAASWLHAKAKIDGLDATDRRLAREIVLLGPRTAPIRAQLAQVQRAESRRDRIFAQRRSGLAAAATVQTAGRALQGDAVATSIDSRGPVEGYATSYEALARVWKRLGSGYVVTRAEPSGSTIRFRIAPIAPALADASRPQ
jgi:hypothetical protein